VTGDIALVNDEGFLRITDRLSRFSKIGGEMVPHGRVEEALVEAYGGGGEPVFAVTAIADPKKGERLAVLTTVPPETVPGLLEKLTEAGLPNLFIPRRDSFIHVDGIPVLGTGKVDLRALRKIANERLE
jgi:acyl-[acyl-carrier-protein]-phospholipid O-acyltransferase/long-chain-fatty-acid--[acyl-carrier-protein] ligase